MANVLSLHSTQKFTRSRPSYLPVLFVFLVHMLSMSSAVLLIIAFFQLVFLLAAGDVGGASCFKF